MMAPLRGLEPPPGNSEAVDLGIGDSHPYARWDAAYVLGALSSADRRTFESHLADCLACREAVAELGGVPALLAQLDREEVAALNGSGPTTARLVAPAPELLPSLLASVCWRRRRARLALWAASAVAAAVLGVGVLVGAQGHASTARQEPTASSQPMVQVGTTLLASTVSLSSQRWGTFINLQCVCLASPEAHHDALAMVVVDRGGSKTQLATWVAEPGHMATPAGSTSMPVDQIAAVQVVSANTGQVLLQHSL